MWFTLTLMPFMRQQLYRRLHQAYASGALAFSEAYPYLTRHGRWYDSMRGRADAQYRRAHSP